LFKLFNSQFLDKKVQKSPKRGNSSSSLKMLSDRSFSFFDELSLDSSSFGFTEDPDKYGTEEFKEEQPKEEESNFFGSFKHQHHEIKKATSFLSFASSIQQKQDMPKVKPSSRIVDEGKDFLMFWHVFKILFM